MALFIKKYQNKPELIRKDIGISQEKYDECIKDLVKAGIIEIVENKITIQKNNLYLSPDSQFYPIWRNGIRMLGAHQINALPRESPYALTALFTADEATKTEIKAMFLEFLQKAQQVTVNAKTSRLYQLNFDLFRWTE